MSFREYIHSFDPRYAIQELSEADELDSDEEIRRLKRKEDLAVLAKYGKLGADTLWTTPMSNAASFAQTGGQQGLKPLAHRFPGEEIAVGANVWQGKGFNPYSYENRKRARERLGASSNHDLEMPDFDMESMPYRKPQFSNDKNGNPVIKIATAHHDNSNLNLVLKRQREELVNMTELQPFRPHMVLSAIKRSKPVAEKGSDGRTYMKVIWTIPVIES